MSDQLAWEALLSPKPDDPPSAGSGSDLPTRHAPGQLWICSGARAAERAVLERVLALQGEVCANPQLLQYPTLVIVPSNALRLHLLTQLSERAGATLGLAVITLRALAERILARTGVPALCDGDAWCDLLARREAAREAHLQALLDTFEDGFALAASSVRDLLSAGLGVSDAPIMLQMVEGLSEPWRTRAGALIRVSVRVREALEREGLVRAGDTLDRATAALGCGGRATLKAREVLIYGFADATGQATGLLQELLRWGGSIWVNRPVMLKQGNQREAHFTDSLIAALELIVSARALVEPHSSESIPSKFTPSKSTPIDSFDAVGADAECGEVAHRIQELRALGIPYERIAVITRALDRYELPIRRGFFHRGVPFSGTRPLSRPLDGERRRWDRALKVIDDGLRCPVDIWLSARVWPSAGAESGLSSAAGAESGLLTREHDGLRLILRGLGVGILADAMAIQPATLASIDRMIRMPCFSVWGPRTPHEGESFEHELWPSEKTEPDGSVEDEGCEPGMDEGDVLPWTATRERMMALALLERTQAEAAAIGKHLSIWPDQAPVAEHMQYLRELLEEHLHWPSRIEAVGSRPMTTAWEGSQTPWDWSASLRMLSQSSPRQVEISRAECLFLLRKLHVAESPLGGVGGGVQVLDVMQARGLTFDHIFVLGLNRSVFPKMVQEDPLLPDRVRRVFQVVLPDLACKARGQLEERHLFAELLSAAPRITLSWLREDSEGRSLAPSAFTHGLQETVHLPVSPVARLEPPWAGTAERPRSAIEAMQLAGSTGDEEAHRQAGAHQVLEAAQLARRVLGEVQCENVSVARIHARRDSTSRPTLVGGSGVRRMPGYLGPRAFAENAWSRSIFITTLEQYVACPWRTLLARLLRLGPVPDPLARLPAIDARLVGLVVHRALEWLCAPKSNDGATQRGMRRASPVQRPREQEIDAQTFAAAQAIAEREGVFLPGLRRALAARSRPWVHRAIDIDWPHPMARVDVCAVEYEGSLMAGDGHEPPPWISFKADRVDDHHGVRVMTDYKTGAPFVSARRDATRARQLERAIRSAKRLQIAAYAASDSAYAASGAPMPTIGRYVFLEPKLPLEHAEVRLTSDDDLLQQDFPSLIALLLRGWQQGIFFPRLEDTHQREPNLCRRCELAEACIRGDSEARAKLRQLISTLQNRSAREEPLSSEEELLLGLWRLS